MPVVVSPGPAVGDLQVLDWVEETRRHLYGVFRFEINTLTNPVNDATTNPITITVDLALGGLTRNAEFTIDDEMFVCTSTSGQTVTAQRGWFGTTKAPHSAGSIIEVNPRFQRFAIRRALQEEIRSWAPSLYAVQTLDISIASTTRGYDFPVVAGFYDVIDAVISPETVALANSDSHTWPSVGYRFKRNVPTTGQDSFPSGNAIYFTKFYNVIPRTVRVIYAAEFNVATFVDTIRGVTDLGMQDSMLDIPPLGAAWRLLSMKEAQRTDTTAQPEPRRAEEVPPGFILNTARGFKSLRDARLGEETTKLIARYPFKIKTTLSA